MYFPDTEVAQAGSSSSGQSIEVDPKTNTKKDDTPSWTIYHTRSPIGLHMDLPKAKVISIR